MLRCLSISRGTLGLEFQAENHCESLNTEVCPEVEGPKPLTLDH